MAQHRFINKVNEGLDPTLGVASYNVQGKGPGYVYNILPLSHDLEQKGNQIKDERYIHPGCKVRGTGHNNPDKHYTGIVTRVVKNSKGEIEFLYIKTIKNNKFVTIDVNDELELIVHKPAKQQITSPNMMNPSNNMKL